ncbi:mannose-6-phosphate isomerase, class I [Thalassiella azotivora]
MLELTNPVRHYPWGSATALPELLGTSADGRPQAELWVGAHPDSPSTAVVDGETVRLDDLVARAPEQLLGEAADRFADRLPFLLKVLAADRPLSLQVHPDAEQARAGYAAEDARGVPQDAPDRCYRDPHHKPEMLLALTDFEVLAGFRDPAATAGVLAGVDEPLTDRWRDRLLGDPSPATLRALVEEALTGTDRRVVDGVAAACARRLAAGSAYSQVDGTVVELARAHPGDPGVLVALLLNRATLRPGEVLQLVAGNLHSYLHGTGVELMACSDNVLRGGLTGKHVDVTELLRVVDFTPGDLPLVAPSVAGARRTWRPAVPDFQLTRVRPTGTPVAVPDAGPRVVLCLDGEAVLRTDGGSCALARGAAVLVPAGEGPLTVDGRADVVVAAVRQDG